MSEPKQLGNIVSMALERARRAQQASGVPDNAYEATRAELLRAEHLGRARPRLRAQDLSDLRHGRVQETKHLAKVRGWVQRGHATYPIMCISGAIGTGKSFVGGWAIAEVGGAYLQANDLVRLSTGSWREQERLDDALRARLLVLDDMGTEPDPEAMLGPFFNVVDLRQGQPWMTLITTNLIEEAFRARYPEPRLWDRLDASWTFLRSKGPNLRQERTR